MLKQERFLWFLWGFLTAFYIYRAYTHFMQVDLTNILLIIIYVPISVYMIFKYFLNA